MTLSNMFWKQIDDSNWRYENQNRIAHATTAFPGVFDSLIVHAKNRFSFVQECDAYLCTIQHSGQYSTCIRVCGQAKQTSFMVLIPQDIYWRPEDIGPFSLETDTALELYQSLKEQAAHLTPEK